MIIKTKEKIWMELFLILLRQEENVLGEVCGDCFLDKLNLDNIKLEFPEKFIKKYSDVDENLKEFLNQDL